MYICMISIININISSLIKYQMAFGGVRKAGNLGLNSPTVNSASEGRPGYKC